MKRFFVLLLVLASQTLFSQNVERVGDLNFVQYDQDFRVYDMIQDDQGQIWIGTENGVRRWNGYDYQVFQENYASNDGFKGFEVNSLYEDRHGNIWVGTREKGLNIYLKGKGFKNYSLGKAKWNIPEISIHSIVEDRKGNFWVNSIDKLYKVNGQKLLDSASVNVYEVDEMSRIGRMFYSHQGELYLSGHGIFRANETESGDLILENILSPDSIVYQMQEDSKGNLFAVTRHSVLLISGEVIKRIKVNVDFTSINSIHIDRNDQLWIGLNNGILNINLDERFEVDKSRYYRKYSVHNIMEDRSGNLFFVQGGLGFRKLLWNYDQIKYVQLPNEYRDVYVYSFHEDIEGHYWIGSSRGLWRYDPKSGNFEMFSPNPLKEGSLLNNGIHSIQGDKDGKVWIATRRGIQWYDLKEERFFSPRMVPDIQNKFSRGFRKDVNGNLWANVGGRLARYNPQLDYIQIFDSLGISPSNFQNFGVDPKGYIWAWNRNEGLTKIDIKGNYPKIVSTYLKDVIPSNYIQWVVVDRLGRVWNSSKQGIIIFDPIKEEIYRHLNSSNLLQQDEVFEMIPDEQGKIWVKQHLKGSISIDPETFETRLLNNERLIRKKGRGYSCINRKGRANQFFTDGTGGFFVLDPEKLLANEVVPEVTHFKSMVNGELRTLDQTEFSADQNNMEIHYVGIQFDNPLRNSYAIKLEGYDQDWNFVGTQRLARYSSLPSGEYKFFVKASNSDGVWSEPKVLASFRIKPPWYKSNWSYIIYLSLLTILVYTIYQVQLRKRVTRIESQRLKELDELKNRFFTNISHEFRTPLTVIMGRANKLKDSLLKRNSQLLMGLINQVLELSKIESNSSRMNWVHGELPKFIDYLVHSFQSLADDKEITLSIIDHTEKLEMDYDEEKIQMIINNLVSNALKFTQNGGEIDVIMKNPSSGRFELSVKDNGKGIKQEDLPNIFDRYFQSDSHQAQGGSGIGLTLTRELVHILDGEIFVESIWGEGTKFKISLPINSVSSEKPKNIPEVEITREPERESLIDAEGRERILLIEDNPEVREYISSVLKGKFEVFIAKNGEEGISRAFELIPDIVISDVMMPGKTGVEVVNVLKNDFKTDHIPIILLTAKADEGSRLEGLKTGADIYLSKPFNDEELLVHIENLFNLRKKIQDKFSSEGLITKSILKENPEFILRLNEVLEVNFENSEFGIMETCHEMGMSRTQLHRKVKAMTGISSSIFIRNFRLTKGRELLQKSEMNVSEVAYSVGFENPNYFTQLYTEAFGNSPKVEKEKSL